ncbi:MAG: PTS sugar transporter subunit IIA [Candidatus Omnitrophota bacterium]
MAAKEISLACLLKEKYINLALVEKDKKKVIAELVALVAKSGKLKNKKAFLKAVIDREKLGSTGIGNGVAIPHAKSKEVKAPVLCFARNEIGIEFGALDGEKTSLFFVLAAPKDEVGLHLKIMAKVAYLVKDKFTIESLKIAKDKKQILKIIALHEQGK